MVTVTVEVLGHGAPVARGRPHRVTVRDAAVEFQLVFFHAKGDYLQRQLPVGARRIVSGRVELFDGMAQMVHPDHILMPEEAQRLPEFEPVYPLTAGVGQRTVFRAAEGALARAPDLPEWIDPALRAREGWPSWRAVSYTHLTLPTKRIV